ncbi:hypothetical protein [Frigoribacterium sp. UYMn621]|uniref:hypothetical protein n=1 Tax=Frigoribacterium sp. UYMn621 TaxID=3156343 RepID=UPI003395E199
MNNTNRALNRVVIVLVGVLLLGVGGAAIAVGSIPTVSSTWKDLAPGVRANLSSFFASAPLAGTTIDWWWIAVLAALAVIVILLLAFIFRQGHGHTGRFVDDAATSEGSTIVDSKVAEQLVQDALDGHPELVSSHVSTYRVRRTPVLKVSATARRGVSPRDIVDTVETALDSLETLLGHPVLASVQVSGGFRARLSSTTRLQ